MPLTKENIIFICWGINTGITLYMMCYCNFKINKKKHVKWWFLLWVVYTVMCFGL
jgi:hypothetical protein